ncbi:MAG: hypothetical protein EOM76_07195 [Sphingobacteriia bacterium]|nr:hypothetical protein [Sphingobacteriia bacterium]
MKTKIVLFFAKIVKFLAEFVNWFIQLFKSKPKYPQTSTYTPKPKDKEENQNQYREKPKHGNGKRTRGRIIQEIKISEKRSRFIYHKQHTTKFKTN